MSVHTLISLVITPAANNAPADCAAAFAAFSAFSAAARTSVLAGRGEFRRTPAVNYNCSTGGGGGFLFSGKNADFPAVLFFFQKIAHFFPKSPPRRFLLYNGANL